MDFRFKILCLLVVLCKSAVFCENDEEDDSVIIEAFPQQERTARQFLINEPTFQTYNPFVYTALNAPWSRFPLATTGSCITSKGAAGKCTSFRQCYPYFKLPELNNFDSWVLGMYDTCSYYTPQGRQMFGVCCAASQEISSTVQPPEVQEVDNFNTTTSEDNAKNQFLDWPPPLPTHPPDHTIPPIPTHPPHHTAPTHPNEFSSTAWPPKPPTLPPVTSGEVQKPSTTTRLPTYPTYPTYVPSRPPTTKPTTPSPVVPTASCGAKNGFQDQERIVGGHNADVGEWPWIAALFNGGRQFCGGSLIDSVHILSAAHCVAHMSSWDVARLTVRLGDHNIKSNSEVRHIEKRVKRVVRHRGFDGRTLYNDIAILTLDSPVAFNQQIRPICLPTGGGTETTGRTGTVIGWGSIREMGPQPAILQEVNIPIWSNRDCKLKYGPAAPGGIVDHMLCAGQDNRDSCSGDSGGPLMVNSGKWTQVGIVSWGIGCGKGQYPGVYTRVEKFLPWINKNLK